MARGNRRPRPKEGTFGARLYDAQTLWIEAKGGGDWRDAPFAKAIGSTTASLSPWWNYGTPPNAHDVILRIAKETGVDPGWLAYGEASRAPKPSELTPETPAQEAPPIHPLQKDTKVFKKETDKPLRHPGQPRRRKQG